MEAVAPRPQGGCGNAAVVHKQGARVVGRELPLPEEKTRRPFACARAGGEERKDKKRRIGVKRVVDVFLGKCSLGGGKGECTLKRFGRWREVRAPARAKPRSSGHRWLRQQLLTGLIWESSTAKRIRGEKGSGKLLRDLVPCG